MVQLHSETTREESSRCIRLAENLNLAFESLKVSDPSRIGSAGVVFLYIRKRKATVYMRIYIYYVRYVQQRNNALGRTAQNKRFIRYSKNIFC